MKDFDIAQMQRLLTMQVKLFEKAHETSQELKPLGIALGRQGIDTSKLYCNPKFLPLPWHNDRQLESLTPAQLSVLSGTFFATAYAEIATSETLALRYNMVTSQLVFPMYSDDYMVLFHETAEEYDHIIAFRALCKGFLGAGELVGASNFEHLAPVYRTYDLYLGRLSKEGFGAMYLLTRYLLNLALKQLEAFMCREIPRDSQDPLAMQIVHGHATDEARHFTTSLELGLSLFRQADEQSRKKVAGILRAGIYRMIDNRFELDPRKTWHYGAAVNALRRALQHEEFRGSSIQVDELTAAWSRETAPHEVSELFTSSRRWIARQLKHLSDSMELALSPSGEAFEKFQDLIAS